MEIAVNVPDRAGPGSSAPRRNNRMGLRIELSKWASLSAAANLYFWRIALGCSPEMEMQTIAFGQIRKLPRLLRLLYRHGCTGNFNSQRTSEEELLPFA